MTSPINPAFNIFNGSSKSLRFPLAKLSLLLSLCEDVVDQLDKGEGKRKPVHFRLLVRVLRRGVDAHRSKDRSEDAHDLLLREAEDCAADARVGRAGRAVSDAPISKKKEGHANDIANEPSDELRVPCHIPTPHSLKGRLP